MRTMKSPSFHKAAIVLALGTLLSAPSASRGQADGRTPVATTPHFAFYNDFATNLNDALLEAGRARKDGKPELFLSGPEESCVDEMAPSARSAWNQAVDYYAEIISPAEWNGRQQYLLRVHLAGFDGLLKDDRARQFAGVAENFRAVATSAYEACRWATQDTENRRWIEELKPRLASHEPVIAQRLQKLYQKRWDGLPIPVDVVETVNWSGATSQPLRPAGGHLLISNSYEGLAALEIVFHEASHLLMGPNDPLWRALDEAAGSLDVPLPDGLWHVVLFYTTGETVRRVLNEAGEPYTPMIYEIYGRSPWGRFREAVDNTWPAYLDGERALPEAAADLLRAIGEPGTKKMD